MITTWEGKIIAVESDEIKDLQDENLFEIYQENSAETEKDWNRQDKISNFTEKLYKSKI